MSKTLAISVELRCPICKTRGNIYLKKDSFIKNPRGLAAYNIETNSICTHSFIAYIDNNMQTRD